MSVPYTKREKVLTDKTATSTSNAVAASGFEHFTLVVNSAAVTSGATIKLQGSVDGTNWYDITNGSISVTATGTKAVSISNQAHNLIRANLSAYTDGTHNAWIVAR